MPHVHVGQRVATRPFVGFGCSSLRDDTKEHSLPVLERQILESRALLGNYLDIYQIHSATLDSGVLANEAVLAKLAQLKQDGKVRWYGISTNNWDAIRQLQTFGPIHVLQIGYNLLEQSADALLHWAKDEEIGTLIRVPLAKGMLSGKYFGDGAGGPREHTLVRGNRDEDRVVGRHGHTEISRDRRNHLVSLPLTQHGRPPERQG